jgi:hypothetical protein
MLTGIESSRPAADISSSQPRIARCAPNLVLSRRATTPPTPRPTAISEFGIADSHGSTWSVSRTNGVMKPTA